MNATMARLEEALVAGATRDFKMLLRFFVLWPTVRLCTLNVMFVRLETLVDTVRFFFVEINFVVQFFCGSFVVLLWFFCGCGIILLTSKFFCLWYHFL